MLKRKRILYLITKSNWGGSQRYVYDLATALPKDRFEAVVALGGDGELKEKLEQAGIRTVGIPSLQRDISLRKELQSFGDINRIVKREAPDILHVNSSKAGGLGAFIGRLNGVPKIVYSAHGWAFNEDRGAVSKFVIGFFHWLTVMFAHVTIAVSKAVKRQMKWPLTQRKIVVVQNGREPIAFLEKQSARALCSESTPTLTAYQSDFWTGTIAELHPIKGHDVALAAIKKLVESGANVRHVIIGEGELREKLAAQIAELDLTNNVFIVGHIHEAARLLPAFDVFVLPSRSEAIGYAVIEAAQAGLPIVASRVGGIPEVITDSWDGILVEAGDSEKLYEALSTLHDDSELRSKLATTARVRGRHFNKERMVLETTTLYNQ